MYEIFDGLRWLKVLVRKRKGGPASSSGGRRMLSHGIQGGLKDDVIVINEGQRACIDANGEVKTIQWP